MEVTSAKNNVLVYRLAILTPQGSVPMSDNYAGDQQKYEKLKQEILDFVHPELAQAVAGSTAAAHAGDIDYEASIRSLLQQGRRIDAIHLIRATQKLSLVEATDRVAALYEQMNVPK
jgi:ribosomal protein L7/L12